jgi:hypothetical protein
MRKMSANMRHYLVANDETIIDPDITVPSKFIDVPLDTEKMARVELFGEQKPSLDGDKSMLPILLRVKDCPKSTFLHFKID